MKRETKSSKRPERSFALLLAVAIARRTAALCCGLTLLVFVFQALRVAPDIPESDHFVQLLATVGLLTVPSILALTLPMATLIAIAATWGDAAESGEILGWRSLGGPIWHLARPTTAVMGVVAVVVALLVSWIGPASLATADRRISDAWSSLSSSSLTRNGTDFFSFHALERDPPTIRGLRWLQLAEGQQSVLVSAEEARWNEEDEAVLEQADVLIDRPLEHGSEEPVFLRADQVTLQLPQPDLARHASPIPEIETWSILHLAVGETALARGQLTKRLVLLLLPIPLALLLIGLIVRARSLSRTSTALLLAVGLAVGLHLAARGTELLARATLTGGLLFLAGLVMVLSLSSWRLLRQQ